MVVQIRSGHNSYNHLNKHLLYCSFLIISNSKESSRTSDRLKLHSSHSSLIYSEITVYISITLEKKKRDKRGREREMDKRGRRGEGEEREEGRGTREGEKGRGTREGEKGRGTREGGGEREKRGRRGEGQERERAREHVGVKHM